MDSLALKWLKGAFPLALLALSLWFATPIGRWITNTFWPGAWTENAYVAFGLSHSLRSDSKPLDPLGRAELDLIDPALATQLGDRPHQHVAGTLMTLSYTTLGENGEALNHWQARAVVPELGDLNYPDAPDWTQGEVPHSVAARVRQRGGHILRGSGITGLPSAAVMRLNIGERIEIAAPDGYVTRDIFDSSLHQVRRHGFQIGQATLTSPARLRVRLDAACVADVRLGKATHLELAPFAPIPIPIGLKALRWVQMTGCAVEDRANPPTTTSPPSPEHSSTAVDIPRLWIGRDGAVHVHEASLQDGARSLRYKFETLCRFDPEQGRWQVLFRSSPATPAIELPALPANADLSELRVLARLPPIALYWLRWSQGLGDAPALRFHQGFGFVGGQICEDIHLGPAPPGQVATCVPAYKSAEARFVPDPVIACAPPAQP